VTAATVAMGPVTTVVMRADPPWPRRRARVEGVRPVSALVNLWLLATAHAAQPAVATLARKAALKWTAAGAARGGGGGKGPSQGTAASKKGASACGVIQEEPPSPMMA
jgi:hypothetical protein